MGIAAYYRGNALISLQARRAAGIPDPMPAKPEPRPAGYGEKASIRALARAEATLAGAKAYGMAPPCFEALVDVVMQTAKVGRATAEAAARVTLNLEGGQ